jgi:hypothetical protein
MKNNHKNHLIRIHTNTHVSASFCRSSLLDRDKGERSGSKRRPRNAHRRRTARALRAWVAGRLRTTVSSSHPQRLGWRNTTQVQLYTMSREFYYTLFDFLCACAVSIFRFSSCAPFACFHCRSGLFRLIAIVVVFAFLFPFSSFSDGER